MEQKEPLISEEIRVGGDQRDRTANLLNAMAEMLWEIREYTENMEDMEVLPP